MTTGDVPDLIRRYFGSDSGTELSRATGGVITPQSAQLYIDGTAKFADFPKYRTIMALSDALGLAYDDELLLAFALSGGQLRLREGEPAIVREIRMQAHLAALDDHPRLVADIARTVGSIARAVASR